MGVVVPNFASSTEDRASGAQVIDGSLRFDGTSQYLTRSFGSGNRKTWTWAAWVKRYKFGVANYGLFSYYPGSGNGGFIRFSDDDSGDTLRVLTDSGDIISKEKFRDTGWYHIVIAVDTTLTTESDRIKRYVNGVRQLVNASNTWPSSSADLIFNQSGNHYLGRVQASAYGPVAMSQVYFIDGLALGPGYFGFTDPLTNVWRPKKFRAEGTTVNDGTVWSDYLSSTGALTAETSGFNGDVSVGAYSSDSSPITFTPPSAISYQTLRVYTGTGSGTNVVSLNGGSNILLNNNAWTTVSETGGSFTTLTVDNTAGSAGTRINAIEVDGVIMLDSTTTNLDFGTNGFYLPMDGNSPIGQDQSGQGNNWTPVNFGGSVALDNPIVSGARPILNTTQGGTQAAVGVFGSKQNVGYAVTVYDDGGGNKYYIDGVKQATLTGLIRGATYTFDTSDSTVSSHPFRFSATSNGSHGGGTEYTNGVAAITGAATTITVPYNAPETLYYYCTSHSGMGADITGITTNEKLADQYASNCTLAIPFVGSKNNVSASIACTSTTGDVTNVGAVASNASSNYYGGSWYFDANGDYLTVPYSADSFNFGTGDFTVEAYVNQLARATYTAIISSTNTSINITNHWTLGYSNTSDMLSFKLGSGGSSAVTANFSAHYGKWSHVAATRESGTIRLFFDGQEVASATDTSSLTGDTGNAVKIGQRYTNQNAYSFNGYMSDLRVYKGVAKYTSNFVPAAASPDILPDTPSGVSGGSKLTKITDGAVSFDGNGDYLTSVEDTDEYDFSSGDWTIEYFSYCISQPTDAASFSNVKSFASNTRSIIINQNSNNLQLLVDTTGSGGWTTVGTTTNTLSAWRHIAITRSSGTITFFVDGQSIGTTTDTPYSSASNDTVYFGRNGGDGSGYFNGFISNARIINGTALYTSNFTPPTRALTDVTNTKLLCCQSNTSAGAAAVSPNLGGINDGRVWSDASNLANPGLLFDGNDDTFVDSSTTSGGNLITSATQFTVPEGQTLTIRTQNGGASNISVNGSNVATSSGNVVTTLLTGGVGGTLVTSITAPSGFNLYYLKVNGVALMDPVAPIGNAAATNFNPFTTDINAVRGQESSYATLNPLYPNPNGNSPSDGNLKQTTTAGNGQYNATMAIPQTGSWYWEVTKEGADSTGIIGISNPVLSLPSHNANQTGAFSWYIAGPRKQTSGVDVSYGGSVAQGDVVGVAYKSDIRELRFYLNGIDQGVAFDASSIGVAEYFPAFAAGSSTTTFSFSVNFGQKPFKFPPPEGFQPLNAANVRPSTVIARPDQYFGTAIYSGTSSGGKTVESENINFTPDFVWVKTTNATENHMLYDSVRGYTKRLSTNNASQEATTNPASDLSGFIKGGFTVGGQNGHINYTGYNYVTWAWKAGGGSGTGGEFWKDDVQYASAADAGLNGGSITPTGASVGTKQGFSIITYTANLAEGGATISHGLTQKPDFAIFKNRDSTLGTNEVDWGVYHSAIGATKKLELNQALISASHDGPFNNTEPTSSLFYFGGRSGGSIQGHSYLTNGPAGDDFVGYIWHNVPGLQKFGSYIGNGGNQFIELGFRPKMVILKQATGTGYYWNIYDSERDPYNVCTRLLYPNTNDDNETYAYVDFLSNGFRPVVAGNLNENGSQVVYAAWAEAPTFNLYGAQSNAR